MTGTEKKTIIDLLKLALSIDDLEIKQAVVASVIETLEDLNDE